MSSDTAVAPSYEGTAVAPPAWRRLLRWETGLVFLLIAVLIYGQQQSTHFFTTTNIFFIGLNMGEIAIMALPLTLIIVVGEIDLSVASMLGLSSTLMGYLYAHHWPIALCMLGVLAVGVAGGALNGWLVTGLGLPSIAVTIGTLALYRGLAEIVLKDQSVSWSTVGLTHIGTKPVSGTQLSWATLIFLVLAIVYGVVLHATAAGRSMYAIGLQSEAARFAGIRVKRIKFLLFVLSGLVCSFAGILWTLRFATSRFDAGTGLELNVVAIVLFGGVSIFGGRGSIFGVLLAVVIFGCLQTALTLQNVDAQVQNVVTGGLLLFSVILPSASDAFHRLRARYVHRP
ncbi:MAG: rhamnose transport system permease protein [Frankiales bacterium]|jgi:rhamnose transport system permease protein|nr:rhamnose transport system permease protein [Frankiales bacterium]MDX6222907.1 rhamnose transport system permease protein [Frankiales bacterium]